jgi:hypothetical protein
MASVWPYGKVEATEVMGNLIVHQADKVVAMTKEVWRDFRQDLLIDSKTFRVGGYVYRYVTEDRGFLIFAQIEAPETVLTAKKTANTNMLSQVLLEDSILPPMWETIERMRREHQEFLLLPKEEQERILAERQALAAAAKEARTCKECGCDPHEHGDR